MKVFISSRGSTLQDEVDLHFGRAQNFIIIDSETKQIINTLKNKNLDDAHGVGIKVAGMALDQGVDACISGSFGPKAYEVLTKGKISLYVTGQASISSVIEDLQSGKLKSFISN